MQAVSFENRSKPGEHLIGTHSCLGGIAKGHRMAIVTMNLAASKNTQKLATYKLGIN